MTHSPPPPHAGIPDPYGTTRPPPAPATAGRSRYQTVVTHFDPHGNIPSRYRIGPAGHPPLEAVELDRSERWGEALGATFWFALLMFAIPVIVWFNASANDRVSHTLNMAGVVAVLTLLFFGWRYRDAEIPSLITAGADWVAAGVGRKAYRARLYELTQIGIGPSIGYDGGDNSGRTNLNLYDAHGGGAALDTALLETNPELWALVYNGIRYSVAHGAEISRAARERLLIDPPPLDQPDA